MEGRSSQWAMGWAAFAGTMMIMLGIWWIMAGAVALFGDGGFYVATEEWVFKMNAPTWGWIHVFVGIVTLLSGFGVFVGATWARVIGVIIAVIAGVVAFAWMPWFPVWAIMLIAISVTVVWALTAHGRDIAEV